MAKVIGQTNRSSKSNIAERIAFDPFISQQSLINELIRNMINPDTDSNQVYYTGQIANIIKLDDKDIDIRDVFYSISDNYERATKSVTDKKYDSKRMILLIHIPSFTTNGRQATTNLNYDNFNKLRVEYNGDKPVQIGNLVKIQFRDKNGFYDPYIIDVENVRSDNVLNEQKKAKTLFDSYLNCKINTLNFQTDISSIDFKQITNPPGGYIQALKEIDNIFSNSYIESFKKTLKTNDYDDLTKVSIELREVRVYVDVYNEFKGSYNYKYRLESYINAQDKNYLIEGSIVLFSAPKNTDKLKTTFYNYVTQDLSSKFNYTLVQNGNGFLVDINLNLILNKTANQKNVADYIEISKKLKDSPTYYLNVPASGSAAKTIDQSKVPDKCNSDLGKETTVYKTVYYQSNNKNFVDEGYRKQDNNIVKSFYDGSLNTMSFLTKDYLYQIAEINNPSSLLGTSNFYISSGQTNDSYLSKDNKLNVTQLPEYLDNTLKFLVDMKLYIQKLEGLQSEEVLIVPLQVIKKKKTFLKGQDPNSRHFYGKAADIVVYLKLIKQDGSKTIVQIQPDIVALYAKKRSDILGKKIGQGIFLQTEKFYNHIEFLDGSGLNDEQISSRVYTGDSQEDEKKIEKIGASSRINYIKQYVREGNKYKVAGMLPEKFVGLTE